VIQIPKYILNIILNPSKLGIMVEEKKLASKKQKGWSMLLFFMFLFSYSNQ